MENIDNKKQIIIDKLEALKQSQFRTVIFGISGSVASIKAKDIVQSLIDLNLNVVLIGTKSALHFINNCGEDYSLTELLSKYGIVKMQKETLQATPIFEMFMEEDEWSAWTKRDDYVLHIELRKLASMLLIAPLSANTMAKISHGICDNLLTNIARCWDFKGKVPFIVAPAMNTMMNCCTANFEKEINVWR
eukprot:403369581